MRSCWRPQHNTSIQTPTLASKCPRKTGSSCFLLWKPGLSRNKLRPSGGGRVGRGTSPTFPPICPHATGVWGAPKMKPARCSLLCTLPLNHWGRHLEEAPGSVTLSFSLNFAGPPSLRGSSGRASIPLTAGSDLISTKG